MPRPKPTEADKEQRKIRARQWVDFRFNNLFTQKKLAEALKAIDIEKPGQKRLGVSRRTVQQVEAGLITPHPHTLKLFEKLVASYQPKKGKT